jgi:hypothetical protein
MVAIESRLLSGLDGLAPPVQLVMENLSRVVGSATSAFFLQHKINPCAWHQRKLNVFSSKEPGFTLQSIAAFFFKL